MRRVELSVALILISSLVLLGCGDIFSSGGDPRQATLEASSPADGTAGVSVLSPATATFSRMPELSSLPQGLRLFDGGRHLIVAHTLLPDRKSVSLAPGGPLDFGTTYSVEVTERLEFLNGETFAYPVSWGFTTEGLPPPSFRVSHLLEDLGVLAHDSMEGRDSGSADELMAAQYLAHQFQSDGLQEPPGGFIQGFSGYARRFDRIIDSQNVLAAALGSGALADEWVVVGAHYDHIGYRDLADQGQGPNNGADDNGSGTVTVLELARLYQAWVDAGGAGTADRRSVLFALFGAEEQGLLGSCAYVFESPAVPIANTVAMMNFDMVGRLRDNTVYVSGTDAAAGMGALVQNANQTGLDLSMRPQSCTGCTDHACFWRAGVPFVGFYTGTHNEYHRPGDDIELINAPGMAKVGGLALRILNRLVVMPDPPGLTTPYPTGQ